MIRSTVKATLRLKDGTELPVGTPVRIDFDRRAPSIALVYQNVRPERPYRIRASSLHRYFKGFKKPPSVDRLMEMEMRRGWVPSVTGKRVEPDGIGPDGSPSWLLAPGLI